jgi:hypothetical protein
MRQEYTIKDSVLFELERHRRGARTQAGDSKK